MAIVSSSRKITPEEIPLKCDGIAEIELKLTAVNELISNPVDIMLVLDESGSMQGAPLNELKIAAKKFIDIIDAATNNGTITGILSFGTNIGIVKFDSNATFVNPPGMTTNTADLKTVIDSLVDKNLTCHGCAFKTARESFDPLSQNHKIIVLFTDGKTTVFSPDANTEATTAKNLGIEIFCLGLGEDIDIPNLQSWATDNNHVLIAPTLADLEQIFEDLAENINKIGATNIDITDYIENDFEIIDGSQSVIFEGASTPNPNYTVAVANDKKSINLTIDELGASGRESATLTFKIKHTACTGGNKSVNKNIVYSDTEGNVATFPTLNNYIDVKCVEDILTNCCNQPEIIEFEPCEEYKEVTLPLSGESYDLSCVGRLLTVYVKLRNVCPNRKVAVGVLLYEKVLNQVVPRGFRAVEITTPSQTTNLSCMCKDINVGPFEFVLPETTSLCSKRQFYTKIISHYSDTLPNYNITTN